MYQLITKFRPALLLLMLGIGCDAFADSPGEIDGRELSRLVSSQKYKSAIEMLDNAKADSRNLAPGLLYYACETYLKVRRFAAAESCYARMERERDKLQENALLAMNDKFWEYVIHAGIAELALELGNHSRAIMHGLKAYQILEAKEIGPAGLFGTLYGALGGSSRFDLGNPMAIPVQGVLALAFAQSGDASQSQKHLAELEKMLYGGFGNLVPAEQQAPIRYWMSQVHFALGNYEAAYRASLVESSDVVEAIWGASNAIGTPVTAVMGEIFAHDYDEARRYGLIENEYVRARALLEVGKTAKAKSYLDAMLADPRIEGFGAIYYWLLYDRGRAALMEGDRVGAAGFWVRAIDVLETQRSSIHDEAGKMGYAKGRQRIYVDMVRLLLNLGRVEEAFLYAERGKARALVDLMAAREIPTRRAGPEVQKKLLEVRSIEPRTNALVVGGGNVRSSRAKLSAARKDLQGVDAEVASLVSVSVPSLKSIQGLLNLDEALLEYFGDAGNLFGFVVTKQGVQGRILQGEGIAEAVSGWREALLRPDTKEHLVHGRKLYDRLLKPFQDELTAPRLIIVPHGVLHYAPFAALYDGKSFLVEQKIFRLLPAASLLQYLKVRPLTGSLLALGNPDLRDPRFDLPGAQREVERIRSVYPQGDVYLRAKASESLLKREGARHKLLHIASHGVFKPEQPLESALLLAAEGEDDGQLTAAELYDLQLDAAVVVLSACETGLGKVGQGDDVIGLNRGFLFAGAASIVSSLWEVDDAATAQLMQNFYSLNNGADVSANLQSAQRALLTSHPHPFYWAAFQVTGAR